MEITYGMDIKSHEDKFLQAAELAQGYLESAVVPGGFVVDTFPIRTFVPQLLGCIQLTIKFQVRHVPDWFPGAGFKRFAKIGRELFNVAVNGPLGPVKESLKVGLLRIGTHISILKLTDHEAGGRNVSIAALCFDRVAELGDQGFDESVIRSVTATMYIGKASRRSHGRECSFPTFQQPRQIL